MFNKFLFSKILPFMSQCGKLMYSLTDHMTIQGMSIACCVTKSTNTHSKYIIIISFPLQQLLHERALILRYTYIACPVSLTCTPLKVFHQNSTPSQLSLMHSWTSLLVKIFFRCLVSTLGLCPQMSVIRLGCRQRNGVWMTFNSDIYVVGFFIYVTCVQTAAHCFPGR